VTAIVVGPRRPAHLAAAASALELELTPAEADEIARVFDCPRRSYG
jgi:aryl-alcohol dehydrogenase-like predicted oxidoreductase